MPKHHPPPSQQQGFTLLEVLISVLILSFGMLGLVGMQAFALQSNREAKLFSEGTHYARELAEMMRGNNQVAILNTEADNPYLTTTLTPTTTQDCLSVGSNCSNAKDVAAAQMTDWLARVDAGLPGARVAVCFDSTPYDTQGLAQWDCTPGAAAVDEVVFIKIGWTQRSTDSSASNDDAFIRVNDNSSRPLIIIPVTGGNPFPLDPDSTATTTP